jgi:hypothetical protein
MDKRLFDWGQVFEGALKRFETHLRAGETLETAKRKAKEPPAMPTKDEARVWGVA